ncbi:MAG: hypothetical protein K8L91_09155 [Anaerolineae bacterium]|nr:hypothetical protein [Anaerolineae bacterium]
MVDHPVILRGARSNTAILAPTLIERTDPDFVEALFDQLRAGTPGLASVEGGVARRRDKNGYLKLMLPMQRVYNVALLEAVCDLYGSFGQPRVDPSKIESAGLVVRRLGVDKGQPIPGYYEGWRTSGKGANAIKGWVGFQNSLEEELDPDPLRRPVLTLGHPELDARYALIRPASAGFSEQVAPLFVLPPAVCESAERTLLFGMVDVTSSEYGTLPPSDPALKDFGPPIPPYLREGDVRSLPLGGYTITQYDANDANLHGFISILLELYITYDLFGTSSVSQELAEAIMALEVELTDGTHYSALLFLEMAIGALIEKRSDIRFEMPVSWPAIESGLAERFANLLYQAWATRLESIQPNFGRFDERGRLYAVRAFVRVRHDDECPPDLIWSAYSEPFSIAAWYESGEGPPVMIDVPNPFTPGFLEGLKPNVAFNMPEEMFNLLGQLDGLLDKKKPSSGPTLGVGWICSLSLVIVFIVAFMLLFMFILILNLIFQWMLFVKICIPYPKVEPA